MATKYLGQRFDIHTGGIDHVRVHHTNEVAPSESALGVHPSVPLWFHNEFLDLGGAKMSKSTGEVLTGASLVARSIDPPAFRFFKFQATHRPHQAFPWEPLDGTTTE